MLDEKTILARLQKGETIEDIAAEVAELLNKASKQYEDLKAKEEEEFQKEKELNAVLSALGDWCIKWYGAEADAVKTAMGSASAKELIKTLDAIAKLPKLKLEPLSAEEVEKTFEDFFKIMNW